MTQDEIIRMAREAGIIPLNVECDPTYVQVIERFAALVAAHEREACAKVCDDKHDYMCSRAAAAIRARNVDSVYTSPERVEKTAESIRVVPANLCQNSTKLVSFGE